PHLVSFSCWKVSLEPEVAQAPRSESLDSSSAALPQFADLGLSEVTLKAVAHADYLNPTPIQAGLIPRALAGVDVLGQARTGTGKTAAFVLPILERLEGHGKPGMPLALILVPTRELAVQVRGEFDKLAHGR